MTTLLYPAYVIAAVLLGIVLVLCVYVRVAVWAVLELGRGMVRIWRRVHG